MDAPDLIQLPQEITAADESFPALLAACLDLDALNRVKGAYIGREGSFAARLMELLKAAPKENKRDLGAAINQLKMRWEEGLKSRQMVLEDTRKGLDAARNAWDATLPPRQ